MLIILSASVLASTISFSATNTHTIDGQTYSVKYSAANSNSMTCSFWVWKGSGDMYDTSEREKADSLSSGQSYNFVTLPLKFSLSSCSPSSSASYSLTSGGGGSPPASSNCQDECSNHYDRWCEGKYVKHCYYDSSEGCWQIGTADVCSGDYICKSGDCIFAPECEDKCNFNGYQCYYGDVYECVTEASGCKDYSLVENCGNGETCSKGNCVKSCQAYAYTNCYNGNVVWFDTCDKTTGDVYDYCESNEKCSHGKCVPDCASHQNKKCYENRPYWYDSCGNREEALSACEYDTEKCENGACVKKYDNECQANTIRCINEKQYQVCKYMQEYGANRWHPTAEDCGEGMKCENDACVALTSETNILRASKNDDLPEEETTSRKMQDEDLKIIADDLVPTAIENTATLFYLFWQEVKQECEETNTPKCMNDKKIGVQNRFCAWTNIQECEEGTKCYAGACIPISELKDCPFECCVNLEGYKDNLCNTGESCMRIEKSKFNDVLLWVNNNVLKRQLLKTYKCDKLE